MDKVSKEFAKARLEVCDVNKDGNLSVCEEHACLVKAENKRRAEKHPNMPLIDCPCEEEKCPGAKNCL